MASSSAQGHSVFPPPRATYNNTTSGKFPDRTAMNMNPNSAAAFGSTLSRRQDVPGPMHSQYGGGGQQQQQGGGVQLQQQPSNPQGQGRGFEREVNPLDEIQEDQREEINEAFQLFDLDRDKHLDYHELRVALRALGFTLSKPELVQILNQHGVHRATKTRSPQEPLPHPSQLLIPQQAFAQLAAQKILERDPREEIERAFELFDTNGKGYIDLEDLRRVARELQETGLEEEELRAMIDEFDLEGIGGVGKEAFVGICLQ